MKSPLFKTRSIPTWAAALSAVLVLTFVALVGNDLHCQYQYLVQPEHGHHDSGPQTQAMDMSHCLYAHQAASTAMPSLGLVALHSIEVVGSSSLDEPLIHVSTARTSLAARAPPAV